MRLSVLKSLGLLCVSVFLGGCATVPRDLDASVLLQRLRENDAKFDNLNLAYTMHKDQVIAPDRFQWGKLGEDPSEMPDDYWDVRTVNWVWSCNLVVRERDIVLISQFESTLSDIDKYTGTVAYQKNGVIDGVAYELVDRQLAEDDPAKNTPNNEKQLYIRHAKEGLWLDDRRMAVEFAHGIGFGKRIKHIDSVHREGDCLYVSGEMTIWDGDVSSFEIILDQNCLVRKATIRTQMKAFEYIFEVSSTGTAETDGLRLATLGTFLRCNRLSPQWRAQGKKPKVEQAFEVRFKRVEQNLSDEHYASLAAFEIQPLMQVEDKVNNVFGTGVLQADGSVRVE